MNIKAQRSIGDQRELRNSGLLKRKNSLSQSNIAYVINVLTFVVFY